ncbi:MAG: hypothetical protein B7Y39_19855 [Bdellovibrio sp. 28-41-41]|nr:MAG: hypothetical protein B7Y39_19855 [Bdellovibrio sp. 28-41-41]
MNFEELSSDEHRKREKAKAYELKQSQWWRQQVGPGICHYCKGQFKSKNLTMDHVIPACKQCNNDKTYKTTFDIALENLNASEPKC